MALAHNCPATTAADYCHFTSSVSDGVVISEDDEEWFFSKA
jgi:hypothetical protein